MNVKIIDVLTNTSEVVTPFLPLLGLVGASLTGFFPRVGPGRAIGLAMRSKFARSITPLSLRTLDIERLCSFLKVFKILSRLLDVSSMLLSLVRKALEKLLLFEQLLEGLVVL